MLMDADVGEGGIKNQPKCADVVYGQSHTQSTEARSSNLDLNGLVGHLINSLHHAEVERDETQIENFSQSELTALDDHAKGKKNSKKKAQ